MSADLAEVRAVLDRTWAAGTARVVFTTDRNWALPKFPARQHGVVARVLLGTGGAVSKAVGRGIYRLIATKQDPLHHPSGEGVVDLTGLRSMVDLGSYAIVQVGGDQWSGRSGRGLSSLPVDRMSTTSPMWLLLLLRGICGAADQGVEEVDGERWRHLNVTASLADASAAVPGGMPSPVRDRFEDLLALPVEVWLDATHLRRLRFTADDSFSRTVTTVTLSDFGVEVDGLDWSRLPTFRSPEEAEAVRRQP